MKVAVTKAPIYIRLFNKRAYAWFKDYASNHYYLSAMQGYANMKLKQQEYLTLNEVCGMIGLPRTKAGEVVGWVYNAENPIGDNYVDFGLNDTTRVGVDGAIVLNFNVDGNILKNIREIEETRVFGYGTENI